MLDFVLAYRKAKVDVFYSSISRREDLMRYESSLEKNLEKLREKIANLAPFTFSDNSWTVYPVSVESGSTSNDSFTSDAMAEWTAFADQDPKPTATFRVMESLPIDFHVLSSLWIRMIGERLDRKLSESVYGCRLRRKKETNEFNLFSLGNFDHYIAPFRKWRSDGISMIREELKDGNKVVAISADVSSYYHSLDASFMKSQDFLDLFDLKLSDGQRKFHNYFVDQLLAWAAVSPFECGLPVGLSASAVIANIALFELDRVISEELSPVFYGRYVDDIILVLPTRKERSSSDLWKWIIRRSRGLLKREKSADPSGGISFVSARLGNSKITFKNKKNRVFNLSGPKGMAFLQKIEANLKSSSSEWRGMPDIPEDSGDVAADLLSVLSESGNAVTSLKDTSLASIKKSELAMQLRDYEAYARAIPQAAWREQRRAFLRAFSNLIVTPLDLFSFFPYLSRVLTLGIVSGDYGELKMIILKMVATLKAIRSDSCPVLKMPSHKPCLPSCDAIWKKFERLVKDQLGEVFQAATSQDRLKILFEHLRGDEVYSHEILYLLKDENEFGFMKSFEFMLSGVGARDLFAYDLANLPYRYIHFPEELRGFDPYPPVYDQRKMLKGLDDLKYHEITAGVQLLLFSLGASPDKGLPTALMFPTRPFHLHELHVLESEPFSEDQISKNSTIMLSQRGYSIHPNDAPVKDGRRIKFASSKIGDAVSIAVTSFLTEESRWKDSIHGVVVSEAKRFSRVCGLIDNILQGETKPDYVVFPELSIPAAWFLPLAMKLNKAGVSLIAGVEYIHVKPSVLLRDSDDEPGPSVEKDESEKMGGVRNQVWVSLPNHDQDFPTLSIYRQDKQRAAIHEERGLREIGNIMLDPKITWDVPPILSHGGFDFAILICSEFSNIKNRAELRGEIDALIIPQWNTDIGNFNSLVESASYDIHAYIVQCNNRTYGDSRIRVPSSESHARDLVRIKGGEDDYFVIGKIDIKSLREFQTYYRSPAKPFKPVPDGFKIARSRRSPKK